MSAISRASYAGDGVFIFNDFKLVRNQKIGGFISLGCCNCCQEFSYTAYLNKTLVTDSFVTAEFPYPRCGDRDGASCSPTGDCSSGGGPPCGPWPLELIPFEDGGHLLHDGNLFDLDPDAVEITAAICPGPGFKCAQARKFWHGVKAFDDTSDCSGGCNGVTTKYRTITYFFRVNSNGGDNPGRSLEGIFSGSVSINQTSGEETRSDCTNTSTHGDDPAWSDDQIKYMPQALSSISYKCGKWNGALPGGSDGFISGINNSVYDVWNALNCDAHPGDPDYCLDPNPTPTGEVFINSVSGTEIEFDFDSDSTFPGLNRYYGKVTLSDSYTYENVDTDCRNAIAFWLFKNHFLFPFVGNSWRSVGVRCEYKEINGAQFPAVPNGCQTIDDYANPTSGSGTDDDPYTAWEQIAWKDLGAWHWDFPLGSDQTTAISTGLRLIMDGSVIGKPFTPGDGGTLVQGLPDRMFSWGHKTWRCYTDMSGEQHEVAWWGAEAGVNTHSADSTDEDITKAAPLWTDQQDAGHGYPGSYTRWGSGGLATDQLSNLQIQKQCESAVKFKAHNRFGPAGFWRHEMDYGISGAISATSGTVAWVAGDSITCADALCDTSRAGGFIGSGDKVVLGDSAGGSFKIFAVASTDGSTGLVLGAEDTDARNVADCYQLWTAGTGVPTGDFGFIGKKKDWKRSGVSFVPPAIWGKVAATVAQDTDDMSKVKVTWGAAQKYTQVGDKIIFVQSDAADTVNNDNSGAGFTLTDAADDSVKFTGTYDPATMKGLVKILGAPLAKWNSNKSRNDFVNFVCNNDSSTGEFDSTIVVTDDRHHGVNTTLGSTPSGDTAAVEWKTQGYPLGTGFPFPTTPAPTTCGGKQHHIPIQYIRHLFAKVPFCIAPSDDPGACATVNVVLPRVEAFTAVKAAAWVTDGAPAIPDGYAPDMPVAPVVEHGFSCSEPVLLPNGYPSPWILPTPTAEFD